MTRSSFAVLAVVIAAVLAAGCNQSSSTFPASANGGYATKVGYGNYDVYYRWPVTQDEAQRILNVQSAESGGKSPHGQNITVYLSKPATSYEVRLILRDGVLIDQELKSAFREQARRYSEALGNARIEVHLCDRHLTTKLLVFSH